MMSGINSEKAVVDEEFIPFSKQSFDLVLSSEVSIGLMTLRVSHSNKKYY